MMTAAEILRAAKALIDIPEKWTPGNWTRTGDGDTRTITVEGSSDDGAGDAYALICAVIAVHRASARLYDGHIAVGMAERELLSLLPPGTSIAMYNDSHAHAEVLSLFDRAIEIAEARDAGPCRHSGAGGERDGRALPADLRVRESPYVDA